MPVSTEYAAALLSFRYPRYPYHPTHPSLSYRYKMWTAHYIHLVKIALSKENRSKDR